MSTWAYQGITAPNFTTGADPSAIPLSATSITTSAMRCATSFFKNNATDQRTITITNTAGDVVKSYPLAPGADIFDPVFNLLITGWKWSADGADVVGKIEGWI